MSERCLRVTSTGRTVDVLHLRPNDVDVRDIAHHLSMICRWGGATDRFWGVAQHSVIVSRLVEARTEDLRLALWGLFHDAAEAYLGDVVAPLKERLSVARNMTAWSSEQVWSGVERLEAEILHVVLSTLGISTVGYTEGLAEFLPESVRQADLDVREWERLHLFRGGVALPVVRREITPDVYAAAADKEHACGLWPPDAEGWFRVRYAELRERLAESTGTSGV